MKKNNAENQLVQVGVGVLLYNSKGKILLGKRLGRWTGLYCAPGGKLEYNETVAECASRELLEEAGISIESSEFRTTKFVDEPYDDGDHWITFFAEAVVSDDVEHRNMEPDKSEGWEWFDVNNLPDNLLQVNYHYITKYGLPKYD